MSEASQEDPTGVEILREEPLWSAGMALVGLLIALSYGYARGLIL